MIPNRGDDYDRYYRGDPDDYYRRKEEPYRETYREPWNGRREPERMYSLYLSDFFVLNLDNFQFKFKV